MPLYLEQTSSSQQFSSRIHGSLYCCHRIAGQEFREDQLLVSLFHGFSSLIISHMSPPTYTLPAIAKASTFLLWPYL